MKIKHDNEMENLEKEQNEKYFKTVIFNLFLDITIYYK